MVTVNKSKLLSYLIVFTIGIVCGKLFFDKKCPEINIKEPVITVTETIDTTKTLNEIVSKVPAVIKFKKAIVPITPIQPEVSVGVKSYAAEGNHYIAEYDTAGEDGFEAHILFDTEDRSFYTKFVLPQYTIRKEKTITIDYAKEIIKTELPEYMIGFGVKTFLKDNTINTLPFLSFSANRKLWFMIATLELKALTRMNSGSLRMEPELEGKINVPL